MPAGNHGACFRHFGIPALQDTSDLGRRQAVGEAQQVHGMSGPAPHGINIGKSIGRGYLSKKIRIIHHRREKIYRLNQSQLIADPVYAGIIAAVKAYQQIGITEFGQGCENIGKDSRSYFGSSACSSSHLSKAVFFIRHSLLLFILKLLVTSIIKQPDQNNKG